MALSFYFEFLWILLWISFSVALSLVRVGAIQLVLTPFRDGIWNRCLVSDGDRGVLPTRPINRRGYALLAHTLGKMRSCAIGERVNTVIHTIVLKKYNYTGEIFSGRKYIPHYESPLNVSIRMYIPHSHSKENISVHRYITHNFSPLNRL